MADDETTDSSDQVGTSRPDGHVRSRLSLIGEQIPVDSPSDELIGVEQAANRRRRRRRVSAGVIGAGVLIAGGVLVANVASNDDPDRIQSAAQADDNEATDNSESDAGGADPEPAEETAEPAATAPAASSTVVAEQTTIVAAETAAGEYVNVQLLPWQDGFLRVQTEFAPQPLPAEFDEEITALFSDDVITLIQEQQPATIEEATQLLTEAGLLEEVTSVLSEHPEAGAAIYGQQAPEPVRTVDFSVDGADWSPVDLQLPTSGGDDVRLQSNGSVLAALQVEFVDSSFGPGVNGPPAIESISLGITDDASTWQEIAVPTPEMAESPSPYIMQWIWPDQLALSETGWAISFSRSFEPDVAAIFPDEFAELERQNGGFGLSNGPDGVSLTSYDDQTGRETEVAKKTWEELGIEPDDVAEFWGDGGGTVVSGSFDGEAGTMQPLEGWGQLVGFSDGFFRFGESAQFSADGTTWTDTELPGSGFGGGPMIQRNGSVVTFVSEGVGAPATPYEFDPVALTWSAVAGPELVSGGGMGFGGGQLPSAAVYEVFTQPDVEPFEASGSVEVDGYTLTITITESGEGYSLTDADGNEVVAEETNHFDGPYEYEHRTHDDFGQMTITDPESGDVLVDVGVDVFSALYEELYRSSPQFEGPQVRPAQRLIAADGDRWIDEQLTQYYEFTIVDGSADGDGAVTEEMAMADEGPWVAGVATQGGLVLVAFSDGSIERFTF